MGDRRVDFHLEKVDGYEVIHDRDRGEPMVLVQRDRLVAAAEGEAALAAALDPSRHIAVSFPRSPLRLHQLLED